MRRTIFYLNTLLTHYSRNMAVFQREIKTKFPDYAFMAHGRDAVRAATMRPLIKRYLAIAGTDGATEKDILHAMRTDRHDAISVYNRTNRYEEPMKAMIYRERYMILSDIIDRVTQIAKQATVDNPQPA